MSSETVRIGIVGAGANTRLRHIPGFRAIVGVELAGVVNRTAESSRRAADAHDIPKSYAHWEELVADPDIDAVMIGTWPNMHCEITCAALNAGKHVLTEARMARNVAEAHKMLNAANDHPNLVAQIVPSPFGLQSHKMVRRMIDEGFLGEIRELVVLGADGSFWDSNQPLHWRQDRYISGVNILSLGILHETAMRWAPQTTRVFAQTTIFETERPLADSGRMTDVSVPDSLQAVTRLAGGGRGLYHFSGIDLFGPGRQIHLYGEQGTIKVKFGAEEQLFAGQAEDPELRLVDIAPEDQGGWRVEEEFIGAIRGEEPVVFTNFATGVKYMEFTEAITRSAESNRPIDLPRS